MSDFVNKVKKGDASYDIQDARIPEIEEADKGMFLHVNESTGALEYSDTVPLIDITSCTTLEDLRILLGVNESNAFPTTHVRLKVIIHYETIIEGDLSMRWNGGSLYATNFNQDDDYTYIVHSAADMATTIRSFFLTDTRTYCMLELPSSGELRNKSIVKYNGSAYSCEPQWYKHEVKVNCTGRSPYSDGYWILTIYSTSSNAIDDISLLYTIYLNKIFNASGSADLYLTTSMSYNLKDVDVLRHAGNGILIDVSHDVFDSDVQGGTRIYQALHFNHATYAADLSTGAVTRSQSSSIRGSISIEQDTVTAL